MNVSVLLDLVYKVQGQCCLFSLGISCLCLQNFETGVIISVKLLVLNMPPVYIGNLNVTMDKNVYMQWQSVMGIMIAPMVVMNLHTGVAMLPLISGHVTTGKHQLLERLFVTVIYSVFQFNLKT